MCELIHFIYVDTYLHTHTRSLCSHPFRLPALKNRTLPDCGERRIKSHKRVTGLFNHLQNTSHREAVNVSLIPALRHLSVCKTALVSSSLQKNVAAESSQQKHDLGHVQHLLVTDTVLKRGSCKLGHSPCSKADQAGGLCHHMRWCPIKKSSSKQAFGLVR